MALSGGCALLNVALLSFSALSASDLRLHAPHSCQNELGEDEDVSVLQTLLGPRRTASAEEYGVDLNGTGDTKPVKLVSDANGNTSATERQAQTASHDNLLLTRSSLPVNDQSPAPSPVPVASADKLEPKLRARVGSASTERSETLGDLPEFLSALKLSLMIVIKAVIFFTVMYEYFPNILAFRGTGAWDRQNQLDAPHTWRWDERLPFFLWLRLSLRTTTEEMIDTCGLDAAFLVRFTVMAMEILAVISVPSLCILCPLYCYMGHDAHADDKLSHFGIGNVEHDSWIHWLVAVLVWINVVFIQWRLLRWQRYFITYRTEWLLRMPYPRNCTVMVEGIDDKYCSDVAFKAYFEDHFGKEEILEAFVVKKLQPLRALVAEQKQMDLLLHTAEFTQASADEIEYYEMKKSEIESIFWNEQRDALVEARRSPSSSDIYATTGFVTFANRRTSEQVLGTRLCVDEECFMMSIPPDPTDVIYSDLERNVVERDFRHYIGNFLIFTLAIIFVPFVVAIAKLTDMDSLDRIFVHKPMNLLPFKETIKGMLASCGMMIMIGMLPSLLMWIFRRFFYLKAYRWGQLELQRHYFWFLLVFVLLVTTFGSSILATWDELKVTPMSFFLLFARRLPITSHFYMDYMCTQWAVHGIELTRYPNLIKYLIFSRLCDSERARKRSEPEDQDYYGVGPRSARFSILLVIGIVFSTICPLILLLTFINFGICRAVHGYLLTFAEQRKADLGGDHWALSIGHVHIGVLIYIILMTGVLMERVKSWIPAAISGSSLLCWVVLYYKCTRSLQWQKLAFEDVKRAVREQNDKPADPPSKQRIFNEYCQPELENDVFDVPVSARQMSFWLRR